MIELILQMFDRVLEASWQAAGIALIVAAIHLALSRRLSPGLRAALWSLVLIRLCLPMLPASRFSATTWPVKGSGSRGSCAL